MLTLENSIFEGNSAGTTGGAFYYGTSSSTVTRDCVFSRNSAGTGGGAIYSSGVSTIERCNIFNNTGAFGAGIHFLSIL